MAAGQGFKTFTTGEVLTAGDVNGYLMQGILVFATSTARDAAITSPQEGQFAYLKDTNVTTYYTGSAWANVDTTGMTNPMTTTGDTIYSSSGSTPARLGIGSTGNVLTVAGGVPTWAAPSGVSTGFVMMYAANAAPSGYLKANGAAISRSTYADLFTAIGTTFGVGDGSTTFNVPDLRGYFPRGWADNGSIDSGRTFGTTQAASSIATPDAANTAPQGGFNNSDGTDGTASTRSPSAMTFTNATYQKVRPVNIALLACIKF
jgi:microcystin-dependent protein